MHQFVQPSVREFLPCAHDAEHARLGLKRLLEAAGKSENQGLFGNIGLIADDPSSAAVLTALFGNSPLLTQSTTRKPEFTARLFESGPEACLQSIEEELRSATPAFGDDDELKQALRMAKLQTALAIIASHITDFSDQWCVVAALTGFGQTANFLVCRLGKISGGSAIPEALNQTLARNAGEPDFQNFEALDANTAEEVFAIFYAIIGALKA